MNNKAKSAIYAIIAIVVVALPAAAYKLVWCAPNVQTVEVFVDKDGRIAFAEDNQCEEFLKKIVNDDVDELPSTDFETLRQRLRGLHISIEDWVSWKMSKSKSEPIVISTGVGLSGGDVPDEARFLIINAHPEARHADVAKVMNCATDCGIWSFTLGMVELDGKMFALGTIRVPPIADAWWGSEVEYEEEGAMPRKQKLAAIWRDIEDNGWNGKGIVIGIGRVWGKDVYVIEGKEYSLAEIDEILKSAEMPPKKIGVVIECSQNSRHQSLIAIRAVCAKRGIPNGNIILFTL